MTGGDRIRVRTGDCELVLQHEYTLESDNASGSIGFAAMKLLSEHAGKDFFRGSEPKLRWHEFFLQPGEPCYVRGDVRMVIDTSREAVGYRENAREPTLAAASNSRVDRRPPAGAADELSRPMGVRLALAP